MAAKKKQFIVSTRIWHVQTEKYYSVGDPLEIDAKEGARLIGLGLVESADGMVLAKEPEPKPPPREPIGKPRSFKKPKREVRDGKSSTD